MLAKANVFDKIHWKYNIKLVLSFVYIYTYLSKVLTTLSVKVICTF